LQQALLDLDDLDQQLPSDLTEEIK
jgi:hypothetical protein